VVPADEPLLDPWLRPALRVLRHGPGGDVRWAPGGEEVVQVGDGERLELSLPFRSAHHLRNALAAVAAVTVVGVQPGGIVDVRFGDLRGEHVTLPRGALVINDCYNANPLSMRAALEDLAAQEPAARRVAVLGDMLELGPAEREHHREVGAAATEAGVDVLVAVGPRAEAMLAAFPREAHAVPDAAAATVLAGQVVRAGDVVLVKGSRGVGLEVVAEGLAAADAVASSAEPPAGAAARAPAPAPVSSRPRRVR
jgi:UDP-N-acetylmuramoyl-tripeptide--D-alanyl-D-alanine ligase